MSRSLLFNNTDWFSVERGQQEKLREEILAIESNRILAAPLEDLVKHFAESFRLEVPELQKDSIVADQRERETTFLATLIATGVHPALITFGEQKFHSLYSTLKR